MSRIYSVKNKDAINLLRELKEVNRNLRKFLMVIPEESIKDYENASEIKSALACAIKTYPPR